LLSSLGLTSEPRPPVPGHLYGAGYVRIYREGGRGRCERPRRFITHSRQWMGLRGKCNANHGFSAHSGRWIMRSTILMAVTAVLLVRPVSAQTGIYKGEQTTGITKQCLYDSPGGTYIRTVRSYEVCPRSVDLSEGNSALRDALIPLSMPSDGLSSPVRPYYLPPPEFPSVWGALTFSAWWVMNGA
jgi:hypothetical protein